MATKRPVSWFLTDQGRKFSFVVVTGTGVALTLLRFTPNTFFINKYKDFVQNYNNGKPEELPINLQNTYEKCLDLLKVKDGQRQFIKPFSVFGYDLFHAGSTSFKFGALVGIPNNFSYNTLDDVENQNIQVNQKDLDLTSEIGHKLGEALLLPDKVKEFAICREILMTKNNKVMIESTYPFVTVFVVYNLSQYLNKRLNLYVAPQALRGILYSIIGLFGVGSYFLFKDMTEVHYETKVDRKLCELGPDYVEAGKIFYDKLLQRNQALRELMGDEGRKKYTKMGNENYSLRQPHISLIHRKQFFEQKLKEISESHEKNINV